MLWLNSLNGTPRYNDDYRMLWGPTKNLRLVAGRERKREPINGAGHWSRFNSASQKLHGRIRGENRMKRETVEMMALWALVLAFALSTARNAQAQDANNPYPNMAPIEKYLMDRDAEIALARSAAPSSISGDATVVVLGKNGYETAVEGKNGFICIVERGWMNSFNSPEFWSPKTRGAECFNPPAARTVVPYTYFRTKLVLAGKSKAETKESIKTAMGKKELPALEAGAMCFMMSKDAYLTDGGGHNMAHLMFYTPLMDGAVWGANTIDDSNHVSFKFPNSPIFLTPQFLGDPEPMNNFIVPVGVWSDGTPDHM
jgi:hypothetical protein